MAQTAHVWRRWLGSLFFALMFFYLGVNIYFHVFQVGSYTGWRGKSSDGRHFYTTSVDPHGPTAALQPGDEVIAINGVHPAQDISALSWFDRVPPGTPFTITVRRDGRPLIFSSQTAPFPPDKRQYDSTDLIFQLICLLFLTTGLAVLLLKPDNRQAWLLALMLGTFIGVWNSSYPYSVLPQVVALLVAFAKTIAFWFFPLFPIFFLNFPERSAWLQRFPRLESWLYIPLFLFILPAILAARLPAAWVERVPGYVWWLQHGAELWLYGAILFYVVAGLFCLLANYRAASPESRKRLRVALTGSSAGFLMLLLQVIEATFDLRQWHDWQPVSGWLQTLTLWALPLIPLSFAYAIARHKVIPVSLIIRRSVRYLLVARGSILLELMIVTALLWLWLDSLFRWLNLSSRRVVGVVSAVVAILVWHSLHWVHRRWLAPMIERRFFRASYDAQQILTELAQSVRTATNVKRLLELVAARVQQALHAETITIFLRETQSPYLSSEVFVADLAANQHPLSAARAFKLPTDSLSVQRLNESGQPLALDEIELAPSRAETETLSALNAHLLLPLSGKDGLLGMIVLGPRVGDVPYSREDTRMLMNVAAQTALAIENTRLIEQTIEQERRRQELEAENERRARELEEARQLQLSLLPKQVPQLPGIEIAAYMKTATEVGGDYYDFYLADDGTLTVVVGDATGHGLKAGTLVSSVKSLFVSLACEPDIPQTFARMSRTLKQMNLRALFMAMTMVKLKDRQLAVSIAGMPPVLIYRAATDGVEELLMKALPLGGLASYQYQQKHLSLAPGDVVLLLSDGLPERFNPAGEMLDYDLVKRAFAEAAAHSPQQVIQHLIQVGEAWAAGRVQDDDVTFVALKVK